MADGRRYFVNARLNHSQWDQPSNSPSRDSLPFGWVEQKVSTGRPYYYNAIMDLTTWERPLNALVQALSPADCDNWIEQIDNASGMKFYVNTATGQSAWERPVSLSTAAPYVARDGSSSAGNWIRQTDPASGRPFWLNTVTNETSWDHVPDAVPATLSSNSFSPVFNACSAVPELLSTLGASSLHAASSGSDVKQQHFVSSCSASAAAPLPAVWRWESDDGSSFNDFNLEISSYLESAVLRGERTFEIAERCWLFDFVAMIQTNYRTQSKRRIQRLETSFAANSNLVSSAAIKHSNDNAHHCASAAVPVEPPVKLPACSAVQDVPVQLVASQSHVTSFDFGAAIGKLAVAAKGIPIDIVHGVYVRKDHDVEAANSLLLQINELHDVFDHNCSYAQIEAAMKACDDSYDAAHELLLEQLPKIKPGGEARVTNAVPAAPAPDPAPTDTAAQEEHLCVICWENPSSHAFIPCGHKHICGVCNSNQAIVDGLKGKCPTCSTQYLMVLHIFES
jgi:hypothetical protein